MNESTAVMDTAVAPEISTSDISQEVDTQPVETGEQGEISEQDAAGAPELEGDAQEPLIVDGKRLSEKAKAFLAETKAKDPRMARELQAALFESDRLRRTFPGGIKDAVKLQQTFDDLGGDTGIQGMRSELDEWRAIDQEFMAGDASVVETMAKGNPESFLKLAPAFLSKYEAMHPEAIDSFAANHVLAGMRKGNVELSLMRLADFIDTTNEKATGSYNELVNFVNNLRETAGKKIDAPGKKEATGNDRETEFRTREQNLTRSEWRSETDQMRRASFMAEYGKSSAGRKLTSDQEASIKELCVGRIAKALETDKDFNGKLQRYFEAGDRQGFVKLFRTRYQEILKDQMPRAFGAVLGKKPGPANGVVAPNGTAKAGTPASVLNQGFQRVPNPPSAAEVDMRHPFNKPENWTKGQAVLVGGKKVQWK